MMARFRAAFSFAKQHLPLALIVFATMAAGAMFAMWGMSEGIDPKSFSIGFLLAVFPTTFFMRHLARKNKPTESAWDVEWKGLSMEKHQAEVEHTKWLAKREMLECRRLKQDLKRDQGY